MKVNKFYSLKAYRKDKSLIKRYMEHMNRVISLQTRYREFIQSSFGVTPK